MHGLRATLPTSLDNPVDGQIALGCRRGPDMHRRIRHLDMQGIAIGVGINRDGADAHPAGGLDDAAGYLTAVGNQNALEHPRSHWPMTSRASRGFCAMSTPTQGEKRASSSEHR